MSKTKLTRCAINTPNKVFCQTFFKKVCEGLGRAAPIGLKQRRGGSIIVLITINYEGGEPAASGSPPSQQSLIYHLKYFFGYFV